MLNAVLLMVLVTAILGLVLTQRFSPGMLQSAVNRPAGENRYALMRGEGYRPRLREYHNKSGGSELARRLRAV